jgi:DNA-binding SARP family transcriptional activator
MTLFCLKTFGGLSIAALHGAPTSEIATRRHALSLLALTAVAGDKGISRECVMALLWPEADDAHARNNLKQLVFAIRHGLSLDVLDGRGPTVRIDDHVMSTDVDSFERAIAAGDHERAVELYAGPFLDGFHIAHLSEFDRWVDAQRSRLVWRYTQALEALARRAVAANDLRGAAYWWRRLAEHDPVNTEYSIGVIDALVNAGEPLGALRHFAEHARAIREEFDVDPDPSVRLAAERVRQRLSYRATRAAADVLDGAALGSLPPILPDSAAADSHQTIEGQSRER